MEDSSILPAEFQKDEGLRTLANFLRSENGVKLYKAVEHEKRVEYFKGKNFVEVLTRIGSDLDASKAGREKARKWPKSLPKISDVAVALAVGNALLNKGFFHRSEKQDVKKGSERILTVSPVSRQTFEEAGVFTWMYQGNMMWTHVMSGALIAVVIGFTLLPIWPDIAKKVLWYISVTVLIAIFLLCLIRFVAFLVMWILGYEFWVFPRLFDETLSFQDSFKPVWTFEAGPPGQGYYRIGLLVGLVAFVAWAMTKPTEFDGFLQAQKRCVEKIPRRSCRTACFESQPAFLSNFSSSSLSVAFLFSSLHLSPTLTSSPCPLHAAFSTTSTAATCWRTWRRTTRTT